MYVIVHDNEHDINIVTYLGLLNFIFVIYLFDTNYMNAIDFINPFTPGVNYGDM